MVPITYLQSNIEAMVSDNVILSNSIQSHVRSLSLWATENNIDAEGQ